MHGPLLFTVGYIARVHVVMNVKLSFAFAFAFFLPIANTNKWRRIMTSYFQQRVRDTQNEYTNATYEKSIILFNQISVR